MGPASHGRTGTWRAGPEPTITPWTIAGLDLASLVQACEVVDGEVATAVRELFQSADQATWFADGDATYLVHVRPLLPDERTCT